MDTINEIMNSKIADFHSFPNKRVNILVKELHDLFKSHSSKEYSIKVVQKFDPKEVVVGIKWEYLKLFSTVLIHEINCRKISKEKIIIKLLEDKYFESKWIGFFLMKKYFGKIDIEVIMNKGLKHSELFNHCIEFHFLRPYNNHKKISKDKFLL
jgi:hypothetical protein